MDGLFSYLKNLDAYSKVNENFYKRTLAGAGGIITIVSFIIMPILFISEIILVKISERLTERKDGDYQTLVLSTMLFSVYRIKDEEGEGCNVYGFLEMNKVGGNFYFVPGKSFQQSNMHVHDLMSFQKDSFKFQHKIQISHIVNKLVFGENVPSVDNPLDGVKWTQQTVQAMYQYFIKMVPTVYLDINGKMTYTYQFSVTEHLKADNSFGTRIFLKCFSTMIFLQSR